jgi:hypothetical protein
MMEHRTFDTQFSFASFVKLSVVLNLCLTAVLAVFYIAVAVMKGDLGSIPALLFLLPIGGAVSGLLSGAFAYLPYTWWCKRNKGVRITGIFVELDKDV